jgi:hypothetical protein
MARSASIQTFTGEKLRKEVEKVERSAALSERSQSMSEPTLTSRTITGPDGTKVKKHEVNKRKAMLARVKTEKQIARLADPNSGGRLALKLYKDIAKETFQKTSPVLMFPIKDRLALPVDLDVLFHDMELALNVFIEKCIVLQYISIWGNLVSLPNFDFIKQKTDKSEYIH